MIILQETNKTQYEHEKRPENQPYIPPTLTSCIKCDQCETCSSNQKGGVNPPAASCNRRKKRMFYLNPGIETYEEGFNFE